MQQKSLLEKDLPGFVKTRGKIGNRDVVLINPTKDKDLAVPWTKDNLHLRSIILDANTGESLSVGFPKFFNYNEGTDVIPDPTDEDLINGFLTIKHDGSCLIVDKIDGKLNYRTRGTIDACILPNYKELLDLLDKHPELTDPTLFCAGYSYLFEWCSPTNPIVLQYSEPSLVLLCATFHASRTDPDAIQILTRQEIRVIARRLNLPYASEQAITPRTLNILLADLKTLEGCEGYCLYYGNGNIKKFKTTWYLERHRLKSHLTPAAIRDLYIAAGCSVYGCWVENGEMFSRLDHECQAWIKKELDKLQQVYHNIFIELELHFKYMCTLPDDMAEKDKAAAILKYADGNNWVSGVCFAVMRKKAYYPAILKRLVKDHIKLNK